MSGNVAEGDRIANKELEKMRELLRIALNVAYIDVQKKETEKLGKVPARGQE